MLTMVSTGAWTKIKEGVSEGWEVSPNFTVFFKSFHIPSFYFKFPTKIRVVFHFTICMAHISNFVINPIS